MIFEKLTLHNFGLFRGKQVLDLRPHAGNGRAAPIVLFGGMNGGGKTTILDAVKLALYGSRGNYSKKSNIAYDAFLRDSITRGVAASSGASVALDFRITRDGEEHAYQVHRAWQQRGRTLRERVCVCKDGVQDQYAADHWTDLVEEVIPLGVSQLFFFDAEQIRFLADEDTAQASLGSAIKSLLGLDLAERLITDAGVLEARFTQQMAAVAADPEVVGLQAELDAKENEWRRAKEDRAALTDPLARAKNAKEKAEQAFAAIGGRHWQEREARGQALADLKARRSGLELQLAQLAAEGAAAGHGPGTAGPRAGAGRGRKAQGRTGGHRPRAGGTRPRGPQEPGQGTTLQGCRERGSQSARCRSPRPTHAGRRAAEALPFGRLLAASSTACATA